MRNATLGAAVMLALVSATGAIAQTTTTTTTYSMTPEQRVLFRDHMTREARPSVSINDFEVQTGAVLPPTVQFYSVPQIDTYQYGYVNNRYVVVDPSSRKVMEVFR